MRVLDLFSGIGGFALGLKRAGMRTVAFCESDPFCRAELSRRWAGVPIHEDIRELTIDDVQGCDLVCGGFPCQDISVAGPGLGLAGLRSGLWRDMVRAIRWTRSKYVIVENVASLLGRGLGIVLSDLAESGYDAEWFCISACELGAPHTRDRVFVVAYPKGDNGYEWLGLYSRIEEQIPDLYHRAGVECWVEAECPTGGLAHGVPDELAWVRALGNAVVPQVVEVIGRAIMEAEYGNRP